MIVPALTAFYLALGAVAADTSDFDQFAGAAEVVHFSFEAEGDRDFDGQPDDWVRRKGSGFPAYVPIAIDRTRGAEGRHSLQFRANGGPAILYSPAVRIDAQHSYLFEGQIGTGQLKYDAALLSVSLLNHKRERVQRFLSVPVSGTHAGWVRVQIGPFSPRSDVAFAVIGCHLVGRERSDIGGAAWFDHLRLGRLPQLQLGGTFDSFYRRPGEDVRIPVRASGLDPGHSYALRLQAIEVTGGVAAETQLPLVHDQAAPADPGRESSSFSRPVEWTFAPPQRGYYGVRASLLRDGTVIRQQQSSFVVMDFVEPSRRGEFGWSLPSGFAGLAPRDLIELVAQSGLNRLKIPLWNTASETGVGTADLPAVLDKLSHRGIQTVGLLNDPPSELRSQFAADWSGVGEAFAMPVPFWARSVNPVIARYSSNVRDWQLGGDEDLSFVGIQKLPELLSTIKQQLDRLGRDSRLVVTAGWQAGFPTSSIPPHFVSRLSAAPQTPAELMTKLQQEPSTGPVRWVSIQPLPRDQYSPEECAGDLVKRMVAARVGGADTVFAADLFHPLHGLLNADGSPTPLYLPWRTTALALQDAEFLGSMRLPGKSHNYIFARNGEAIALLWNSQPATELLFLGHAVVRRDLWSRDMPATSETGRALYDVGPQPILLRGGSEPLARWQLAARFEKGKLESRYGAHQDALLGRNPFPQGVSGTVTLNVPGEWEAEPRSWKLQAAAGEAFRLPVVITLPAHASLGEVTLSADFDIVADRPYRFRIEQPYHVGLGDIDIQVVDRRRPDGGLEIEQTVINRTEPLEVLNFRCSLFVPGLRRERMQITRLGRGEDRKIYVLPDAESLRGKELWLRAEQVDGLRVLNYKWTVGRDWPQ